MRNLAPFLFVGVLWHEPPLVALAFLKLPFGILSPTLSGYPCYFEGTRWPLRFGRINTSRAVLPRETAKHKSRQRVAILPWLTFKRRLVYRRNKYKWPILKSRGLTPACALGLVGVVN